MDRFFHSIFTYLNSHKLLSFLGMLFLFALLGFSASKLVFEEDISKLIPTNAKSAEIQKVLKSVNFTDKIIVNIQLKNEGTVEDLVTYATKFVDSVQVNSSKYVKRIQGKIADEDLLETVNFVYQNLPVFLEAEDYETINQKLSADSIHKITETNFKTLISPSGIIAKKIVLRDPLGISFLALNKLKKLGVGDDFKLKSGFIVSQNEKNILIFITPTFPSSETDQNSVFANQLFQIQENLNTTFKDRVESEYFGAVLIAVANANQIKKDIQFTVGIALVLLVLILIFFYRKIYIPFILFVPTIFGGLLAVTILFLFRGKISAISLGIGSVLLGVTLDYSLHILTHIRNHKNIKNLYSDVTEAIIMSSLTTSLAFLCLLFLDSQALQDLGIFAAVSVLGASLFALVFIPLVYKTREETVKKNTLIDRIAGYAYHKNKWIGILLLLLLIVSIFSYNRVEFNKDISKLNFQPEASIQAEANLDALTKFSSKSIYLATHGKSVEETLQVNDSIYKKLEDLKSRGTIESFSNIGALVLSKKAQRQKIEVWNQFWDTEKTDSLKKNLIENGTELGFKPDSFEQFYSHLDTNFEILQPEDYQQLPSVLLEDFITTEADFTTITSLVKIENGNEKELKKIFKAVPKTLVIDRQEVNETFLGTLKNDFNQLMIFCLLAVILVLFAFFRSVSLTLVTAFPIFITWFLTVGIMGIFGIQFNIFNIIISTFIFGLGIDYSIFITKGLLKEIQTGERVIHTHKTSILLSVLTTLLGVGVLIFAKHPALYSISLVSIIGITAAVLVAFTVQPLLFNIFVGSQNKRPVSLRMFLHSVFSFGYFGLGGLLLSLYSSTLMRVLPISKKIKMLSFHTLISKYMKSVLYTNPFVKKAILNETGENFSKPAIIIANHSSFLDILSVGMLHPKICFLVNDWVYNSPVFGKAVQLADFYPVSSGIDGSVEHLRTKTEQGYSLMIFPEGTRSTTNKIRRFHKGAFYLAEQLNLDILPVLIHGNSEVLPKSSFVIKDGSITIKMLPRIHPDDFQFGKTYTERAKKIASYFKNEFRLLRNKMERPTYFHTLVLEEYRFKGNSIFKTVKKDLKDRKEIYFEILNFIASDEVIVHYSEGFGQLDFLLILDAPDREIHSIIPNVEIVQLLNASYLTHQSKNLKFSSILEIESYPKASVVIIGNTFLSENIYEYISQNSVKTVILLTEIEPLQIQKIVTLGFEKRTERENLVIFKKRN